MRIDARLLIASALLAMCFACGVVVSFDDYEDSPTLIDRQSRVVPIDASFPEASLTDVPILPRYAIRGLVAGLGTKKTKLHVADLEIEVSDGPFASAPVIPEGLQYGVTVDPVDGHLCTVQNGSGTMPNHDVEDVVVSCPSSLASLESLSIRGATLAPTFSPDVFAYSTSVTPISVGDRPLVAAEASDPTAIVRIGSTPFGTNVASRAVSIKVGSNTIPVQVLSGDRLHFADYAVTVDMSAPSYAKSPVIAAGARFGKTLAMTATTLVVGAPDEDHSSLSAPGAAYVFIRSGNVWVSQARLVASNVQANAHFGASVAIDGDTIIVGAPGEASAATGTIGNQNDTTAPKAGAAYVFTRFVGAWTQQRYLKASNTRADQQFGSAVTVSGDYFAVGAPFETNFKFGINVDETNFNAAGGPGSVYVFKRSGGGWGQVAYVKPSGFAPGWLQFGTAVLLSGSTLVVGAPGANSIDIIVRDAAGGWSYQQPFYYTSGSSFGAALAFENETLVVGAPGYDNGKGEAWTAVRNGTTWTVGAALAPQYPRSESYFGHSVTISGSRIAVGARGESSSATTLGGDETNTSTPNAGAVFVFAKTTVGSAVGWSHHAYVKATNTRSDARFGSGVALSGDMLVVGSDGESSNNAATPSNTSAPNAGAFYVY